MKKDDWVLNYVGLMVKDWDIPMGYYQSTEIGVSVGPQIIHHDFAEMYAGPFNVFLNNQVPPLSGGSGVENNSEENTSIDPTEKNPSLNLAFDTLEQVNDVLMGGVQGGVAPSTYHFMDKDCQVRNLLLEVIQDKSLPLEGITHVCYSVPDPVAETKKLIDKGCEVSFSLTHDGSVLENYVDTRQHGNVMISFRPSMPELEKKWTAHNRAHPMVSDWQFHGLGIVVRDLDKTVAYYESLEIADFQPETQFDSGSVEAIDEAGSVTDVDIQSRTRTAMIGKVAFEFVQPLEGKVIYGESLDKMGEGVCDMAFTVANLEQEIKKLSQKGIEIAFAEKSKSGPAFAYFDTREQNGNVMIRLIQRTLKN